MNTAALHPPSDFLFYGAESMPDTSLESRSLAWSSGGLYVMANFWWEPLRFEIQEEGPWREVLSTSGISSRSDQFGGMGNAEPPGVHFFAAFGNAVNELAELSEMRCFRIGAIGQRPHPAVDRSVVIAQMNSSARCGVHRHGEPSFDGAALTLKVLQRRGDLGIVEMLQLFRRRRQHD